MDALGVSAIGGSARMNTSLPSTMFCYLSSDSHGNNNIVALVLYFSSARPLDRGNTKRPGDTGHVNKTMKRTAFGKAYPSIHRKL